MHRMTASSLIQQLCGLTSRRCSTATRAAGDERNTKWSAARLDSRALLQLDGKDCFQFLQGLVTNDVKHLLQQPVNKNSLYAFLLNPSGRIIADVMIYQRASDGLLVECDREMLQTVTAHLTSHKLRAKVSISETDEFKVWSLFPDSLSQRVKLKDLVSPSAAAGTISSRPLIVNDSRLPIALYRVISRSDQDCDSLRKAVTERLVQEDVSLRVTSEDDYRNFRYRIGVSEGSIDHPVNVALPLESNGDYLNGISFFKGCYIGQELTARSYHTGVIRKRLMPIAIRGEEVPASWAPGLEFRIKESKKLLGKVRSVFGKQGLALLYIDLVKQQDFHLDAAEGTSAKCHVPFWWPTKLPPEAQNL